MSLDGVAAGSTESGVEAGELVWSVAGSGKRAVILSKRGEGKTGCGAAFTADFPTPRNAILFTEIPDLGNYAELTVEFEGNEYDSEGIRVGFCGEGGVGFAEGSGDAVFAAVIKPELGIWSKKAGKVEPIANTAWKGARGVVNSSFRLTFAPETGEMEAAANVGEDEGGGTSGVNGKAEGGMSGLRVLQIEFVGAGNLNGNFPRVSKVKVTGTPKR
jgi:hypothetical protein